MKKSLLSTFAMLLLGCGFANAEIHVSVTNVEQPQNDTLLFALPENPNCVQEIWTTYTDSTSGQYYRVMKFQPEYLVTAADFACGDVNLGTANLPAHAKVIGLSLNGFDSGKSEAVGDLGVFHDVTAWCRNIPRDKMELDYLDLFDGYATHDPVGQLCTDTATYHGHYPVSGVVVPGVYNRFDLTATATNPSPVVDIPFGHPSDSRLPFWYTGENIYLTLWLCNWFDVHMQYYYMAYDQAEATYASLMRSGDFCFNSETQDDIYNWFGQPLMYDLPQHRLPAFRTPYYTNDVRFTIEGDPYAVVTLQDAEGNVYTATDNKFFCLDHTKTYKLYVDKWESGDIKFDDIYKDVEVKINKDHVGVEEIDVNKEVASVRYFNLAGQESAQPMQGMNIVVTTYTDGTRTSAKVVK